MKDVLISIIVPIFNGEAYLENCINSLIKQTYNNIEIIIIDDGSIDNSAVIIDSFARQDDRIKVIHQDNKGQTMARLRGVECAQGEYVLCVDIDDFIDSDMIASLLLIAINENADVVICGYKVLNNNTVELCSNNLNTGVYTGNNLVYLKNNLFFYKKFYECGIIPAVWNKLIKRDLFLECQRLIPNEIRNGEDVALTYSIIRKSEKVVIKNELKPYNYRIVQNSISRTRDDLFFYRSKILFDFLDKEFGFDYSGIAYYKLFMILIGINSLISYNFKKKGIFNLNIQIKKSIYSLNTENIMPYINYKLLPLSIKVLFKSIKNDRYYLYILNYLVNCIAGKIINFFKGVL